MAVLKCKMCGGSLDVTEGMTVCECEYCGTTQTIPQVDDEKKITLFSRANRLRSVCEFDKAASVYENIVSDFPEEAEAYWGLILCKFGIEYVDDPATGKKIPTCHRSSFESIMDDSDFEQCMENADPIARKVYREEAKPLTAYKKAFLKYPARKNPTTFLYATRKRTTTESAPLTALWLRIFTICSRKINTVCSLPA